jgi:hypothetical protein
MPERKELPEAWQDLKDSVRPVFEPPLLAMTRWLDRQLQRAPRLYRWLSR